MHLFNDANFVDLAKVVSGFPPGTPSGANLAYVDLSRFERLCIVLAARNATSVSGSAVTLRQAKDTAGTGEKPLSFTRAWANYDTAASDALVKTAVAGDTFTTNTTSNKNLLYVIAVAASSLDVSSGFRAVRLGLGNASNTVLTATYFLGPEKYL